MKKTLSTMLLGTSLLLGANEARAFPTIPINIPTESSNTKEFPEAGYAILGLLGAATYFYLCVSVARDRETEDERKIRY